jgi:uroporphyrin-3 C-methyltransferase
MSEQAPPDSDAVPETSPPVDSDASTGVESEQASSIETESKPASRSGVLPIAIAIAAIVIGASAALGALLVRSSQRELADALAAERAATETEAARFQAQVGDLEEQDRALREDLVAAGAARDALEQQLADLPVQIANVERRIDAVQGGTFGARERWLRAEAEYYLSVANNELMLAGRWHNAELALELADDRLREIGDPALAPVRSLIADELLALRGVSLPDIEGLALSLERLAATAARLPLRSELPQSRAATDRAPEPEAPGLERLWATTKNALLSLVRVERLDEPVQPALAAEERTLVRRQFGLELQIARLALVQGQPSELQAALASADRLLAQDFDTAASEVQRARALLAEVRNVDIAPHAPDISASLRRLREIAVGPQ